MNRSLCVVCVTGIATPMGSAPISRVTRTKLFATVALTAMLLVTGFSVFIWVASTGWRDSAAVASSIVFVLLSTLQGGFTFFWYKGVRVEQQHKYIVNPDGEGDDLAAAGEHESLAAAELKEMKAEMDIVFDDAGTSSEAKAAEEVV